jgi:hypothetical protein
MTLASALAALSLPLALCACAAPAPATPASTAAPAVRCRTVLEMRPGVLGTAGNPTPVQQCEPELPAPD